MTRRHSLQRPSLRISLQQTNWLCVDYYWPLSHTEKSKRGNIKTKCFKIKKKRMWVSTQNKEVFLL